MLQVLRAQVQVRVQVPDPQVQVQVQVLRSQVRVQVQVLETNIIVEYNPSAQLRLTVVKPRKFKLEHETSLVAC